MNQKPPFDEPQEPPATTTHFRRKSGGRAKKVKEPIRPETKKIQNRIEYLFGLHYDKYGISQFSELPFANREISSTFRPIR
jgi:hypothetical protein